MSLFKKKRYVKCALWACQDSWPCYTTAGGAEFVFTPYHKTHPVSGQERMVVRVDLRHFRLTEVETLSGDASSARKKLGWMPNTRFGGSGCGNGA